VRWSPFSGRRCQRCLRRFWGATIYGVGVANLLLIPLANKVKGLVLTRYNYQEMMLEGMAAIAQGQNPRVVEQRLQGYMS